MYPSTQVGLPCSQISVEGHVIATADLFSMQHYCWPKHSRIESRATFSVEAKRLEAHASRFGLTLKNPRWSKPSITVFLIIIIVHAELSLMHYSHLTLVCTSKTMLLRSRKHLTAIIFHHASWPQIMALSSQGLQFVSGIFFGRAARHLHSKAFNLAVSLTVNSKLSIDTNNKRKWTQFVASLNLHLNMVKCRNSHTIVPFIWVYDLLQLCNRSWWLQPLHVEYEA